MLVVLDANILLANLRGSGPSNDLKLLLAESRSHRIRVVVPQVVLDEVVNKRREKAVEAERRLQQARSDFADLGASLDVAGVDVGEVIALFRERVATLLSNSNVTVRAHPRVDHARIVQRALERRKPFAQTGAGYRDALIWESVLELVQEDGDEVALVSNNSKDFADGNANDRLASDLIDDLTSIGAQERVLLVPALDALVRRFVSADTIAAEELDDLLNEEESPVRRQFFERVSERLRAHVFDRDDISERTQDPDGFDLPYGASDVRLLGARVLEIDRPHTVWVHSAHASDDQVLVELEAEVDAEIEVEIEFEMAGEPYDRREPWHREGYHSTKAVAILRTLLIGAEATYRSAEQAVEDVYVHHVSV